MALEIAERVAALGAYFAAGATAPAQWRHSQLDGLKRLLVEEQGAVVAALFSDLGKPHFESYLTEIAATRREVDAIDRGFERWVAPCRVRLPAIFRPGEARVEQIPLGVVAVVAPWNLPIYLVLAPLAAALAAGNCAVVKPSELAPASSELLSSLLPRYLDSNAVLVLEGGAAETQALITAGIDYLFFTGSAAVGRLVAEAAGRALVPATLELGGKCPAIVLADADLPVTARRIVWGKFINAGQTCIAPDYVLVEASVEAELVAELRRAVERFFGPDPKKSKDFGRIVNERHFDRLSRLLSESNGEIVVGGEVDRATRYIAPTVVRASSGDTALLREEIFGPILPVIAVADWQRATSFVAERSIPLSCYLFTADRDRADDIASRVRSGSFCVNVTMEQFAVSSLPFGGIGESGYGRAHGRCGVESFCVPRAVLHKRTRPELGLAYPPSRGPRAALLRRFF